MTYSSTQKWGKIYSDNTSVSYPAEAVIRIFKGSFPELTMPKPRAGETILDVGCGDGRHLIFFKSLGLLPSGIEITDQIIADIKASLSDKNYDFDLSTGDCSNIPYADKSFDYLIAWNSCYYMSLNNVPFEDHVNEMARVIKPGGRIIVSIPKSTSFIFKNSIPHENAGYQVIQDDHFNARNGEVMRCFETKEEIQHDFSGHFGNFNHADIEMKWFGLAYNWFIFVAEKLNCE
ncbi:class I SAM-dependent methyltransferase [Alphaproteobacteria bacterium]|nr:class I SAM-dependent methyltransferase [Alphaproteobacteria bacterium]